MTNAWGRIQIFYWFWWNMIRFITVYQLYINLYILFFSFFLRFKMFYFLFIFLILKSLILTCVPKHEPPSHLPPHNISLGLDSALFLLESYLTEIYINFPNVEVLWNSNNKMETAKCLLNSKASTQQRKSSIKWKSRLWNGIKCWTGQKIHLVFP